jgi:uncharacterized NAD-dependent epimerase/dehydratase family protein
MEGSLTQAFGKMGHGILRYSPNPVACVVDSEHAGGDVVALTGIPRRCPVVKTLEEARSLGAEVFVLGIAPPGGSIPSAWYGTIDHAVQLGMSVLNGLHDLLGHRYPELAPGQWIWDVRVEPEGLTNASGAAATLPNQRVLMVGSDMAIGKMTAGLEVQKEYLSRGKKAEFVATGQIGITITGAGVPLDAVRLDFASGAIEREVLRYRDADVIVIEGQGSLVHPASTANLPLLRGSMPTHLIFCHRAGQTALARLPEVKLPPLPRLIQLYEDLGEACGSFARPRTLSVALNTAHVALDTDALDACKAVEDETGLPCADPVRHGCATLCG